MNQVSIATAAVQASSATAATSAPLAPQLVGCVERTAIKMVGSGTMYPWSRSSTLGNVSGCSGPVRVTHHDATASVLDPPYGEKPGIGPGASVAIRTETWLDKLPSFPDNLPLAWKPDSIANAVNRVFEGFPQ